MKILIIGSEGFIGSNLLAYFRRHADTSRADVLDISSSDYSKIGNSSSDFKEIFSKHSFDACINASGSAIIRNSFSDPKNDFDKNTANVLLMLEAIRQHNPSCKFINLSSAAVYGFNDAEPLSETHQYRPASPYGYHKLMSEYVCREYYQFHNVSTCSARIFSVYGPGQKNLLFWDLWNKYLADKDHIRLFGSGNEQRDYIYIEDLCRALHTVIEKNEFNGDAINIANGNGITIRYAAETFVKILHEGGNIEFTQEVKTGDPANLVSDNSKLAALGYKPSVSFEEGLEKYVTWLRENQ